jgi:hypothetical protein
MSRDNKNGIAVEAVAEGIESVRDIGELNAFVSSRLPQPGRIANVNIYCSRDTPGRVVCLVDVLDIPAGDAARALGGVPFAFTAVVLDVRLSPAFTCRTGQPGRPVVPNCNCSSGCRAAMPPLDP